MSDDGFKPGDWKAQCFRCGATKHASTMRKQWQGYYVCHEHWEPRQPQDFVRGVPDQPAAPWVQPDNVVYVGPAICDPAGKTAIPAYAVPGCMIPAVVDGVYAN